MVKMTVRESIRVAVDSEIKGFTIHAPDGDVPGYLMRFQIQAPTDQEQWTDWLFLREDHMERHLRFVQHFLTAHGHLSESARPTGPVQ